MKKILLGVTAFTLFLASCQQSEVIDDINAGNNQLDFGVYQGKVTKAAELTNEDLNENGVTFPLYAYKGKQSEAKEFYFEETLTYGILVAGKWNTSIPRFLADEKPLQFYAFYPTIGIDAEKDYKYANLATGGSYPTLDYTIQGTDKAAGTEIDLVAAAVNDNTGTKVTIPFRHILSQINFGVKGYYGAQIEISNIEIHQVNSAGTYNFDLEATDRWTGLKTPADYAYKFGSAADAKNSSFITPGTAAAPIDESGYTYIFGDGGKWGPGSGSPRTDLWYVNESNDAIQASEITADTSKLKNSLMLMPQPLVAGMSAAYVTFNYTIQDLKGAYVAGSSGNPVMGKFDLNMGTPEAPNPLYDNEWKPNLRYLYIIDFTGYLDGQKLTFDVDVDTQPWENYDKPGDGIVLLSSTGEPVFKEVQDMITTSVKEYSVKKGNVFSNIKWDWSTYTLNEGIFTVADQSFTVNFKNVKFNGNTITIVPPKGFKLDPNVVAGGTTPVTMLTFKTLPAPSTPETNAATKDDVIVAGAGTLYMAATWSLNAPATVLASGEYFIVDASKVWLNGQELTVTAPAGYKLSGSYPKYKITKE